MTSTEHWDAIYATKADAELSWTQSTPRMSLSLIHEVCPAGRVVDVGGGNSVLVDKLLDGGYRVCVLDISEAALSRARHRLGERVDQVRWITADITTGPDLGTFDLWHDRAVFHFLTDPTERAAYVTLLSRTVRAGGHVVFATFALDGPERCSGLEVRRYDETTLGAELGMEFDLIKCMRETHHTPWGKPQAFQYSVFKRR